MKVFGVDDVFRETAPFYVGARAPLRRGALRERAAAPGGLRVELAMDLEKQRAAQAAML